MSQEFGKEIEQQIETWTGVIAPNNPASVLAEQLDALIKSVDALRGTLAFEDEPSSFEAALQYAKE